MLVVVADVAHHINIREPLGVLAVGAPLHALGDLVLGGARGLIVPGASTRAAMLDFGWRRVRSVGKRLTWSPLPLLCTSLSFLASAALFATVLQPILTARILVEVADVPHHVDVREPLGVLAVGAPLRCLLYTSDAADDVRCG